MRSNLQFKVWLRCAVCCVCCCIASTLFTACSSDDDIQKENYTTHTYKVAVLLHNDEFTRWQLTAQWAMQNIAEAQQGMKDRVQLELTYKDQDAPDIVEYMEQIARDTSIVAIIGPTMSLRADRLGVELGKRKAYNKPMITPSCTYVHYQRKFANVPYVWNLAESDITEMEVILSDIASIHTTDDVSVELLTADDETGESRNDFVEWFSFIAEEYGLKVSGLHFYKNSEDMAQTVREFSGPEMEKWNKILVFSPGVKEDGVTLDEELGRYQNEVESAGEMFYVPRKIYCTDGFVTDYTAATVQNYDYEGVDLYASPESGFIQAYHQRVGSNLVNGQAQFFDAICLVAYAATLQLYANSHHSPLTTHLSTLNDCLLAVVDGRDEIGGSWLPGDMKRNFELLSQGVCPDIDGVSSDWTFDKKTHASVLSSTYRRWRINDGQFATIEYVSTEGSRRSSSTKTMWDWTASHFQVFSAEEGNTLSYPAPDNRWALLVAASKGWANYRFQADVFAMYKLLRNHGFLDDHILLICEDDLANYDNNPYPGELRISDTGMNLYNKSAIDYKLSSLTPDDIGDILQGRASDRLPMVLSPDSDDNVFIFWSSHGSPGSLDFGGNQKMIYSKMKEILASTPHRKLLMAVEACYSGGLGQTCEGLPGCLFITAANPYETSHAAVWSETVGVYLSNGFTRGFQEAIDESPSISLRDLYYTLGRNTSGSHVKVYNDANYGSIYSETMAEFLNDN